jgi:hypothetical protein
MVAGQGVPASAQMSMAEFARGARIQVAGRGPVVRLSLPESVYTTVTRPDLADIRVFNGAGEPVPHALRHAPAPEPATATLVGAPIFPLRREVQDESLLTQVAVGANGAIVEVRGGAPPVDETVGYLVDATSVKVPVDRLTLDWMAPPGTTFLARVNVDASGDLTLWRPVAAGAAIANLQYGDRQLTQADIDLSGPPVATPGVRYFRISWPKELASVRLAAVRLRPRSGAPERDVTWAVRPGIAGDGGVAEYDTGGRLPVEYLDLDFVDDTDVASVIVRSRPDPDAEWRQVHTGAFFTATRDGTRIHNPPAEVALNTDRYWQVEDTRQGGWPARRAPRLRLGWHAHELLFVPRGQPPFTLAFGNLGAENAAAPIEALLAGLGAPGQLARPEPATLAETRDIAGPSALEPPRPIRRIVLWAVLVAAVVALALLVARASREMKGA